MAIELLSAEVRSARRVRMRFSSPLATASFDASHYDITCPTPEGAPPSIREVLLIAGDVRAAELVLGSDLQPGVGFDLHLAGVTDTNGDAYSGIMGIRLGAPKAERRYAEARIDDDVDATLFGVDLVWNGRDFALDASGDLATVAGRENVLAALSRGAVSNGLPWDPGYGAQARRYVDGTAPAMPTLRGALLAQIYADRRVQRAKVTFSSDEEAPDTVAFDIAVTLLGEDDPIELQVALPIS